jgi:protein-S-isoprenylcysteine O-methyltransferase Ste14
MLLVAGAGLFLVAGTFALPMLWAYLIVAGVIALISMFAVDADLLRERIRPGPGGRDHATVFFMQWLMVGHLVLAALDIGRIHWSDTVPFALQVVGLAGFALGMGFAVWAMLVNPFFSSVVRLQTDRGHRLITNGPYGWVRHPGYAGIGSGILCSGLLDGYDDYARRVRFRLFPAIW